jgi:hypothetical protein
MPLKAKATKEKVDKLYFIKIDTAIHHESDKDNLHTFVHDDSENDKLQNGILKNHVSDKGLISKIYTTQHWKTTQLKNG